MTDYLRDRIAALHQAHRWGVFRCNDGYARTCCRCQWRELPDGPTHAEHVADAVIRELGRYEYAVATKDCEFVCMYADERSELDGFPLHDGERIVRRYVTEWETDNA